MFEVFAIYDRAVGAYMQPFFSRSKGEALRSLAQAIGDAKHPFAQVPTDYTLFKIGSWDDVKGTMFGGAPEKVIGVWELMAPKE